MPSRTSVADRDELEIEIERLSPRGLSTWAKISAFESGSLTSATVDWALIEVADGVAVERADLDDWGVHLSVTPVRVGRVAEIAKWLVTTSSDAGLDLPQASVEILISDNRAAKVGAGFTDDQTASLDCELSLDGVESGEVEFLLEWLRRLGRGDAVDSIREPDSEAARRREARLLRLGARLA